MLIQLLLPSADGPQQALQGRIAEASPGDTIVVEGGTHRGPLVIDRSLVVLGRNNPVLLGDEETHVVVIQARGVTISGFTIRGSGTSLEDDHAGILVRADSAVISRNRLVDVLHGIYVKGSDYARITENEIAGPPFDTRVVTEDEAREAGCDIPGDGGRCDVPLPMARRGNGIHIWKSTGNTIADNTITKTRDGIYFSFADSTHARRNAIRDVRFGLHYMYSDHNVFDDNTFHGNVSGSAIMYSADLKARRNTFHDNRTQQGYGLLVQSVDDASFVGNRLTNNGTGIYLENSTRNSFRGNVVAGNYRGLRMTGSSMHNRFGENVLRGNLHTAAVAGVSETNEWHIAGRGNYWGPGGLVDLDGDGVSELPHRTVDVMGGRQDEFPYVGLLAGSPGLTVLTEAIARVSVPGIPAITDHHALMRPPLSPGTDVTAFGLTIGFSFIICAAGVFLLRRYRS